MTTNPYKRIDELESDIDELTVIAQNNMTILEGMRKTIDNLKLAFLIGIVFTDFILLAISFK